jgi:hypothetical protein
MQRSFVKTPGLVVGPGGVLELMLDIEQPDTDRRRQNHDRQVQQQEGPGADQPTSSRQPELRWRRSYPSYSATAPGVTHPPYRQPMPQDEQRRGTYAEYHYWMSVQTIKDLTPSRPRDKLADGQHVNVAGAPLIEIA